MPLASLLTWAERRQSAMMQDRLGPNRANIGPIKLKGILHFVADALEDDLQGGLHPGERPQGPVRARARPRARAGADRVRIIPFGPTIYPHAIDACRSIRSCSRPIRTTSVRGLDPHADLPGRLRPDLLLRGAHARELRRHDRRLGELQQVGAARRPAQLVADDVVRGRDGPVADGRVPRHGHARAGRDRDARRQRLDVRLRTRSTGCGCGSRSASSCSSRRRSPRPSARRSTSRKASPRSSATSSSTPACAGACSSSPSSSRSSSSPR